MRSLFLILIMAAGTLLHPLHAQQTTALGTTRTTTAKPKKDPRPMRDRLWFGGGVVLMFGTVTNLGVAPQVGYKVDQKGKFSTGIGLNYFYFKDDRYIPAYESTNYGWSVFTRYRVIPQAFLHAEFNNQNYELFNPFSDVSQREWVPFLLLGGGVSQHLGGNSYLTFQVLWDVILDERSPFGGQPWITGGVGVGF